MNDPVFISLIFIWNFVFDYGKKTRFLKFDCGSTKSDQWVEARWLVISQVKCEQIA